LDYLGEAAFVLSFVFALLGAEIKIGNHKLPTMARFTLSQ
jgi:hypothetical protein